MQLRHKLQVFFCNFTIGRETKISSYCETSDLQEKICPISVILVLNAQSHPIIASRLQFWDRLSLGDMFWKITRKRVLLFIRLYQYFAS